MGDRVSSHHRVAAELCGRTAKVVFKRHRTLILLTVPWQCFLTDTSAVGHESLEIVRCVPSKRSPMPSAGGVQI